MLIHKRLRVADAAVFSYAVADRESAAGWELKRDSVIFTPPLSAEQYRRRQPNG
jgi:hypothetical protein